MITEDYYYLFFGIRQEIFTKKTAPNLYFKVQSRLLHLIFLSSILYESIHDMLPDLLPEEESSSFHLPQTVILHPPYESLQRLVL